MIYWNCQFLIYMVTKKVINVIFSRLPFLNVLNFKHAFQLFQVSSCIIWNIKISNYSNFQQFQSEIFQVDYFENFYFQIWTLSFCSVISYTFTIENFNPKRFREGKTTLVIRWTVRLSKIVIRRNMGNPTNPVWVWVIYL